MAARVQCQHGGGERCAPLRWPYDNTVDVKCTSYEPNGVVYWGGLVSQGTYKGEYEFGRISSGGPNVGTFIGELTTNTLTCYNGSNRDIAGPPEPILAPKIIVGSTPGQPQP